ncbi:ABC transporter permease [Subtercola endophyticus]|uniref:ABC transporter permease n=1 Tax=Subtercola endophyticus TaxID=2895559 RepID=UPI001E4EF2D8|nr:ABC transporter permease [Subtercola endophyticus]UFS58250.1 ABC transporter permease [Subtercola endophyticus]
MNGLVTRLKANARDYGIVFTAIALVIILSTTTTTFFTQQNLVNLFDQMVVVGILACAVTIAMIAGVIDLSMSAIAAVSAIIGATAMNAFGIGPGVVVAILVGVALGAFNGLAVTYGKVNAFIATLATGMMFRGFAVVITGGQIVAINNPAIADLSKRGPILNITWASWVLLLVVLITGIMLWRSVYGRTLYAVGGNPAAARISGISVGWAQTSAFMISGGLSAIAGVVLASRSVSAQPSMGTGLEFTAIAAAVIGGVSFAGGQGAIWRAILGVFLLQMIANGFNLLGLPTTFQQVVQGLLILVAVAVDQLIRRRKS